MPQKMKEFTREELIACLKFSMENSDKNVKLPVCIWGWHGVGKTELMKQICQEMDYNLVCLHLSTQDMIDLIGRPITETIDGHEIQKWAVPNWLSEAKALTEKTGRKNVFFLDEMNRAHQLVLNAMLPFLIEGVLHEHRIGDGDVVMAACNPPDGDNYEVNEITDKAFLDRLGHAILSPTAVEYISYLRNIGMDPITISVVETNPNFIKIPEIDPGFVATPSRRSIVNVMSKVGKKDDDWIKENGEVVIECFLGEEFKDKWLSNWHSSEGLIDIHLIMQSSKVKQKAKIRSILFGEIDGIEVVKNDILENCAEIIKNYIVEKGGVTETEMKWILDFFRIDGIPSDALAALVSTNDLIKRSVIKDLKVNRIVGELYEELNIVEKEPFEMGVFA